MKYFCLVNYATVFQVCLHRAMALIAIMILLIIDPVRNMMLIVN